MIDLSEYITGKKECGDIWKVYFENIPQIPIDARQHFLVRANLAGWCEKSLVDAVLREYSKKVNGKIDMLKRKEYSGIVKGLSKIYTDSPSDRKRPIGKYFLEMSKNPEASLAIATGVVAEMVDIYLRTGNGSMIDVTKFSEHYSENIDSIEDFMSKPEFFKDHFPRAIVSYVNTWWYLRNFSVEREYNPSGRKISIRIMDGIRKWLSEKYVEGKGDIESIVYGITHVVIGASRFYTRRVSQEYVSEIELLADSMSRHKSTEDIRLETALCLKLSKIPQWQYLVHSAIKNVPKIDVGGRSIVRNFDSTGNDIEDIVRNEHTNSLYLLCCSTKI